MPSCKGFVVFPHPVYIRTRKPTGGHAGALSTSKVYRTRTRRRPLDLNFVEKPSPTIELSAAEMSSVPNVPAFSPLWERQ